MASRWPSEFVGQQVRAFRALHNWRQEDLVAELEGLGFVGWRQSKIAKLERGQAKRIALEEVFELAAALGVAPIYLFTPDLREEGELVDVRLGDRHARRPAMFRQWVRGMNPLFRYRTEQENEEAQLIYYVQSQPLDEWRIYGANLEFANQMAAAIELMSRQPELTD